jgi:hypothetical protein
MLDKDPNKDYWVLAVPRERMRDNFSFRWAL